MERPVGSFFPVEGIIVRVVYDEFHDCRQCVFDPEFCDTIANLRGTCCNRLQTVVFKQVKEIPKTKK